MAYMDQTGGEVTLLIRLLGVNMAHISAATSFLLVEIFRGFLSSSRVEYYRN
jgi:hypothetical protein